MIRASTSGGYAAESRINSCSAPDLGGRAGIRVVRWKANQPKTLVVDEAKCIHVTYEKIGEFWLPGRNETIASAHVGEFC